MSKKNKNIRLEGRDYLRTVRQNNDAFYDYLDRITKIATSIFKWKNLPDSMDGEYLELCLYWYGQASFVYDEKMGGHINLKATTGGELNIYGLPTQLCCYSYGYNKILPVYNGEIEDVSLLEKLYKKKSKYERWEETCIHVLNNRLVIPTVYSIERFADRLAEADITADINVKAQKTPVLLLGTQNQVLTLKNLYNQYAGGQPVIYGDKDIINLDSIKAIKTDAPFIANDLMAYKKEIWNELLTFLGINNIVTDKRERQIKDEVNSNNELININLKNSLVARQNACDLFNKKYGLKGDKAIKVELNSDLNNVLKEVLSDVKEFRSEFNDLESLTNTGIVDINVEENDKK